MASSRNEHVRFRYGICLNDGCSKCKSKEVQEISARKDLICAECGKPLRECPRPRTWWEKNGKKVIGGVAAAVVVAGGVVFGSGVFGGEDKPEAEPVKQEPMHETEVETKDTVVAEPVAEPKPQEKPKSAAKPKAQADGMGTLDLGYGKYTGYIRNGQPDGSGVLTYTKEHKVVSTKDIVAQPGERIEGVFENGKPTFVTLYKKDGNAIKIKR